MIGVIVQIVLYFVLAALIMHGTLSVVGMSPLQRHRPAVEETLPSARPRNPEMAQWYDEALTELGEYDPEAFEMLKYLRDPPAPSVVRPITSLRSGGVITVPNSMSTGEASRLITEWGKNKNLRMAVLPEGAQYQEVAHFATLPAEDVRDMRCAHCGWPARRHTSATTHPWQPKPIAKFVEGCHCQTCEDHRASVIDAIVEELEATPDLPKPPKQTASQKAQAALAAARAEYEYEKQRRIEVERWVTAGKDDPTSGLPTKRSWG